MSFPLLSALRSPKTIALVSSLLAGGLTLDDIPYWRDGTLEKYSPSGDYVVVKFARWAFEKFDNLESESDIQNNFEKKDEIERIEKALQKIPTKQREVFVMKNFEEMTYKEISEITGKSVGGLKANYFHALKRITELLDEENK